MKERDAARILYTEGWTQKEIARTLRRSEKTICTWKQNDNWDKQKSESLIQRQTAEEGVWELILYQLNALKNIKQQYEREGSKKLISKGDIDALQKLFTTVKGKELEWSTIVKILREFAQWLKNENLELAQELVDYMDAYLNEKRRML
ncbi:terminase gpP N-terminus-related DNA-binding protein [Thermophagus sp. OGC60D27]|uniref:terminase gpP N-terminus-related DNA-binding protein n=1 Tax=Thermophagus sp. OGC60D27 TaxID=3458415 RepID=UPI0040378BDE